MRRLYFLAVLLAVLASSSVFAAARDVMVTGQIYIGKLPCLHGITTDRAATGDVHCIVEHEGSLVIVTIKSDLPKHQEGMQYTVEAWCVSTTPPVTNPPCYTVGLTGKMPAKAKK